jgi:hypothetical protein
MYVELHAYQHHVFMDWRFVDDERWKTIQEALKGAGVESMQAKWDELFGEKKEEVAEGVKVKKPRKKAAAKKVKEPVEPPTETTEKKPAKKRTSTRKPVAKKS